MFRRPCRYFNTSQGCQKGNDCTFLHVKDDKTPDSSSKHHYGEARRPCRYFDTPGGCSKGDQCTFLHPKAQHESENAASWRRSERGGSLSGRGRPLSTTKPAARPSQDARNEVVSLRGPKFDVSTISALQRGHSDVLMPSGGIGAHEATARLLTFLHKSFEMRSAKVANSLGLTLVSMRSWSENECQDIVARVAGEGLPLLRTLLTWREIAVDRTFKADALSFPQAYVPILLFLASEAVLGSMIQRRTMTFLGLIDLCIEQLLANVKKCLHVILDKKTLGHCETRGFQFTSAAQVLWPVHQILEAYVRAFREAPIAHGEILLRFLEFASDWADKWLVAVEQGTFDDAMKDMSVQQRSFLRDQLQERITSLQVRVRLARGEVVEEKAGPKVHSPPSGGVGPGHLAALQRSFEPPGELRALGPRHDNDHACIKDIRVLPTMGELRSNSKPFLPCTVPGAPHHLAEGSVERLFDTQFRLLREEMVGPLRETLGHLCSEMELMARTARQPGQPHRTNLERLLSQGGGRYRGPDGSADLRVYGDGALRFNGLMTTPKGVAVRVQIPLPPDQREAKRYWEALLARRLTQGALVACVSSNPAAPVPKIFLGTVAVHEQLLRRNIRSDGDLIVPICFFDAGALAFALQPKRPQQRIELLAEVEGVLVDTLVPFLTVLQKASEHPREVPMSQYFSPVGPDVLRGKFVSPPLYARTPGFHFDLKALLNTEEAKQRGAELFMTVEDSSKEAALGTLEESSTLDRSQSEAVVSSLTREVALIQGPPGTGKSFVGVAMVDALLQSKVGKVLVICETNHALDTFLRSLLSRGIDKMIRLGSRSKDEKIQSFVLQEVMQRQQVDNTFEQRRAFAQTKVAEKELQDVAVKVAAATPLHQDLVEHLANFHPDFQLEFEAPPQAIAELWDLAQGWMTVRAGRATVGYSDMFDFWINAGDLEGLGDVEPEIRDAEPEVFEANSPEQRKTGKAGLESAAPIDREEDDRKTAEDDDELSDTSSLLSDWGFVDGEESDTESDAGSPRPSESDASDRSARSRERRDDREDGEDRDAGEAITRSSKDVTRRTPVRTTERPLAQLLEDDDIWSYSPVERRTMCDFWYQEMRESSQRALEAAFEKLEDARTALQETRDQQRINFVRDVDVVGCTSNGAAKQFSLIAKLKPSVVVVEEAGQVLEAHVLALLVPGVQQVLFIGDPMQLRPHVARYALSIENKRGGQLYRLDLSLMERLASESGVDMAQLNVQRRMRPEIADFARPLYRNLTDYPECLQRGKVRGMGKNVAFLDHTHAEGRGRWGATSKINEFEAEMAVSLAKHLIRQGYNRPGDLCILVPYLGQLAILRERLAREHISVVVDERDEAELTRMSEDSNEETATEPSHKVLHATLSSCLRCSTVDNFQGEEARIVILSLVRNSGPDDEEEIALASHRGRSTGIGFVKSTNRANVALSRARDGMYILGNSTLLASQTPYWDGVMKKLAEMDAISTGFPLQCSQHPDEQLLAREPHQIDFWAPDGGCSLPCEAALECGHLCRLKCHPGDPKHLQVRCLESCSRLHAGCRHPCSKRCADPCGRCDFLVPKVELACGHTATNVPCWQATSEEYDCQVPVEKALGRCEHSATMACSADPLQYQCKATCDQELPCCGRKCQARCSVCQRFNGTQTKISPQAKEGSDEEQEEERQEAPIESVKLIKRSAHQQHACDRAYPDCRHVCRARCSKDHVCQPCTARCEATPCIHGACTKPCSAPCRICLMPCAWAACAHRPACTSPCGTPCSRLPCDAPCPQMLECGHPCPSICGEPCQKQLCPRCSAKKEDVVDVLLCRPLAEIDTEEPGLDNRIITLACGHAWTVETLDAHMELESFYTREGGEWISVREPSTEFRERKGCPTCRLPITSPRYGRVVGRALLDQHERALSKAAAPKLQDLRRQLAELDGQALVTKLHDAVKAQQSVAKRDSQDGKAEKKSEAKAQNLAIRKLLKEAKERCPVLPVHLLADARLTQVKPDLATLWRRHTAPLLVIYERAMPLTALQSPHVKAWEAAIMAAYGRALGLYDPMDPKRQSKAHAEARRAVATPEPRGDDRFCVEAIAITLEIRLLLVAAAEKAWEAIPEERLQPRANWAWLIRLIFQSMRQDAATAVDVARTAAANRLHVEMQVLQLRVNFEVLRYKYTVKRRSARAYEDRHRLSCKAQQDIEALLDAVHSRVRGFIGDEEGERNAEQRKARKTWYETTLQPLVAAIEEQEAPRFVKALEGDKPLSAAELAGVASAFSKEDFRWSGHWYRCQNGHLFVIGDCGMAMELSECPECGAPVGGKGHRHHETNRRDVEMDRLAMQAAGIQRERAGWFGGGAAL